MPISLSKSRCFGGQLLAPQALLVAYKLQIVALLRQELMLQFHLQLAIGLLGCTLQVLPGSGFSRLMRTGSVTNFSGQGGAGEVVVHRAL